MKVWTDEEKLYINENFRYEPDTGLIYWKKKNNIGQPRKMDKPVGSYEGGGYLQISVQLHNYQWRIRARDAYAIEKHGSDCGPTNKDIGIY